MQKFTIITINYNNLRGLIKTIDSVQQQTFRSYEYIIVDGLSTDGSVDYIKSVKDTKIIIEKDKGIYDAMNKGILHSNGDYIIFMNSGDCFSGNNILESINTLIDEQHTKVDFIYGDAYEENEDGTEKIYKKSRGVDKAWYGMFSHHQSMVFSNHIIKDKKLLYNLKFRLSSDWDFVLRFLKCTEKKNILYIPNPMSVFEMGGFSSNFLLGIKEQATIRKEVLEYSAFKRYPISILHYLLNVVRNNVPFIYKLSLKLRS